MPWTVEQNDDCPTDKPWGVVNEETGKIMGCHSSEADAKQQLEAIYANYGKSTVANLADQRIDEPRSSISIPATGREAWVRDLSDRDLLMFAALLDLRTLTDVELVAYGQLLAQTRAEWTEDQHPRGEGGKFIESDPEEQMAGFMDEAKVGDFATIGGSKYVMRTGGPAWVGRRDLEAASAAAQAEERMAAKYPYVTVDLFAPTKWSDGRTLDRPIDPKHIEGIERSLDKFHNEHPEVMVDGYLKGVYLREERERNYAHMEQLTRDMRGGNMVLYAREFANSTVRGKTDPELVNSPANFQRDADRSPYFHVPGTASAEGIMNHELGHALQNYYRSQPDYDYNMGRTWAANWSYGQASSVSHSAGRELTQEDHGRWFAKDEGAVAFRQEIFDNAWKAGVITGAEHSIGGTLSVNDMRGSDYISEYAREIGAGGRPNVERFAEYHTAVTTEGAQDHGHHDTRFDHMYSRQGQDPNRSDPLVKAVDDFVHKPWEPAPAQETFKRRFAQRAEWDEEQHPRDEAGKFSDGEGGGGESGGEGGAVSGGEAADVKVVADAVAAAKPEYIQPAARAAAANRIRDAGFVAGGGTIDRVSPGAQDIANRIAAGSDVKITEISDKGHWNPVLFGNVDGERVVVKPLEGNQDGPKGFNAELNSGHVNEALSGLVNVPGSIQYDTPEGDRMLVTEMVPGTPFAKLDQDAIDRIPAEEWQRMAAFDYITMNRDRNPGNIMVTEDGKLYSIDHSQSFGSRMTNAIPYQFVAGQEIHPDVMVHIQAFVGTPEAREKLRQDMGDQKSQAWKAIFRAEDLVKTGRLPTLEGGRPKF